MFQAQERPDLEEFLESVATTVAQHVDLDRVRALAANLPDANYHHRLAPPAQRIAIAQDQAFAFAYPHILADWRDAGAEISFFSPLANDAVPNADMIYLPGGYPELHAGRISQNKTFMQSLKKASQFSDIYGECGGYMTLGKALIDAQGVAHKMAGLLQLETSFAHRKLHLGYRNLSATCGPFVGDYKAHEFHYATTIRANGPTLFKATDAEGNAVQPMGTARWECVWIFRAHN